jgi:hypothetical protein
VGLVHLVNIGVFVEIQTIWTSGIFMNNTNAQFSDLTLGQLKNCLNLNVNISTTQNCFEWSSNKSNCHLKIVNLAITSRHTNSLGQIQLDCFHKFQLWMFLFVNQKIGLFESQQQRKFGVRIYFPNIFGISFG